MLSPFWFHGRLPESDSATARLLIGFFQVGHVGIAVIVKPGAFDADEEASFAQLEDLSGVDFLTAGDEVHRSLPRSQKAAHADRQPQPADVVVDGNIVRARLRMPALADIRVVLPDECAVSAAHDGVGAFRNDSVKNQRRAALTRTFSRAAGARSIQIDCDFIFFRHDFNSYPWVILRSELFVKRAL